MADDDTGTQQQEQQPPQQQPPAHQPPAPQQQPLDLSGVMQQLQALPEQISKAVREAVTPPKAPSTRSAPAQGDGSSTQTHNNGNTTNSQQNHGNSGSGTTSPGKRKSFADWWFN